MNHPTDYHFVNLYHPKRIQWTISLLVLVMPFYLNDFFFLKFESNIELISIFDVSQRLIILALCYYLFGSSGLRLSSSVAPKEKKDLLIDCVLFPLFIGVLFLSINMFIYFVAPPEWNEGFRFGRLANPILRWLDLTLGLALVSISEELIFRRHVYSYFASLLKIDSVANIIQAVLFGLIHWSAGVTSVINATIFGLIAGLFYDRKKYLLPVIILHFLVNFMIFLL